MLDNNTMCRIVVSKKINEFCHYARFMIGPILSGEASPYGILLRRTLLNLRGPYIALVAIHNVLHEFDTIAGLKESPSEILNNFSKVVIKDSGNLNLLTGKEDHFCNDSQTVNLKYTGPGILTAKSIEVTPPFEIVDPSQYIATIETDITVNLLLCIKSGNRRNLTNSVAFPFPTFLLSNNNQVISNVNTNIVSNHEGSDDEFLILEVWTNGGITPDRAVRLSGSLICEFYTAFLLIHN